VSRRQRVRERAANGVTVPAEPRESQSPDIKSAFNFSIIFLSILTKTLYGSPLKVKKALPVFCVSQLPQIDFCNPSSSRGQKQILEDLYEAQLRQDQQRCEN
jgi:hypothetical protein